MPIARRTIRAVLCVAAYAAAALGCGAPSAALLTIDETPATDALHYFSPDAPVVVAVDTGPDGVPVPGVGPLAAFGERHGLLAEQVRPLLGGELVAGIPLPGAAPLAALVAADADALAALAEARALDGRAARAGRYRDAQLYAAPGHAFAVRNRTLLVSRTTADLRDALDRREADRVLGEPDLEAATPEPAAGTRLARAYVDLAALLPRAGWRELPYAAALERAAVTVTGDERGLVARLRVDTDAGGLVELDVPISPGDRAPLAVQTPAPFAAVRDLAHVLGVADRALAAGAPVAHLRLRLAQRTLRHRGGVDLAADLVRRLHGPATLIRSGEDVFLRADPSRPVRGAVRRIARVLPAALERARAGRGFSVRRRGALHELRRDGRAVLRFGVVRGRLVAGTGAPHALRMLGRLPLRRAPRSHGALAFGAPGGALAPWLSGWRLDGWLRGAPGATTGELRVLAP